MYKRPLPVRGRAMRTGEVHKFRSDYRRGRFLLSDVRGAIRHVLPENGSYDDGN